MSNAVSGIGAKFKRSDMASSPTFTAIAEVTNIDGPNKSRDTIDVTTLDSDGGYREFISGLRDGGEVQLDISYTYSGYDLINDDFEDDNARDYQITLPDADKTVLQFSALVTALGLQVPMEDRITCNTTLKISGPVTLSTGP